MSKEAYKGTVRLTVAQAIIRFLSNQYTERDGVEHRLIAGAFGIFGHGNVAGIGQALLQNEIAPAEGENPMPYIMPRNEQGAVHAATATLLASVRRSCRTRSPRLKVRIRCPTSCPATSRALSMPPRHSPRRRTACRPG